MIIKLKMCTTCKILVEMSVPEIGNGLAMSGIYYIKFYIEFYLKPYLKNLGI